MHIESNRPASNVSRAARAERLHEAVAAHSEKVAGLSPEQVSAQRHYCAQALDDMAAVRRPPGGFPKL